VSDIVKVAFHLKRSPFAPDLPPDDLYLDDTRKDAVDRLLDAVTRRRHVLVKGESGVGKNCVLRAMRDRLSPVDHRLVYVSHVTLGPRDFYRQVCVALDLSPKGTPAGLFEAIQRNIQALHTEHRVQPVLILDEAHLMPDRTFAHLHVLANFDWDSRPLLTIVLVGLPELHDRLKLGIHRSLLTRIGACIEVPAATAEHTSAYVRKRVADAGARGELFAPDALVQLHELTGGALRSVDVVAETALRLAAQAEVRLVDRALVRKAFHHTPLA